MSPSSFIYRTTIFPIELGNHAPRRLIFRLPLYYYVSGLESDPILILMVESLPISWRVINYFRFHREQFRPHLSLVNELQVHVSSFMMTGVRDGRRCLR